MSSPAQITASPDINLIDMMITHRSCCAQGVQQKLDSGEHVFWLCDPAIHCEADLMRFAGTNLGKEGVKLFFHSHKCNNICRALKLKGAPHGKETYSGTKIAFATV